MVYLGELEIKLYRAVSEAELADILSYGMFRPCPSGCSMEGKWFAESLENALEWGKRFYASNKFHVVIATVSLEVVAKMYPREENLDGIGKAIWADEEILDQIKPLEILSVSR